jgi:hypothetical protein
MLYLISQLFVLISPPRTALVTLEKYPDYEIYSVCPHRIKKIGDEKAINISLEGGKYKDCKISGGRSLDL